MMIDLNKLEIESIDSDCDFFWVVFKNGESLQCCVNDDGSIDSENNGYDWGICGDVNDWYIKGGHDGEDQRSMLVNFFLCSQAILQGINVG